MNKGRIAAAGGNAVYVFERNELTEASTQTAKLTGSAPGSSARPVKA
jgi:hypothetical protein